jgi:heme-degrading monooxygenase HmoA
LSSFLSRALFDAGPIINAPQVVTVSPQRQDGGIQNVRRLLYPLSDRPGGLARAPHSRASIMIAVIFEVWPKRAHREGYLAEAKKLRSLLESIDGFISIERFESLTEAGKILSLSFFENENALKVWRNTVEHRKAQALGRSKLFDNYRLRIAAVVRDYGMNDRAQAPDDSRALYDAGAQATSD